MNESKEYSAVKDYIYSLGYFWQSFNALELHLRIYLNKKNGNNSSHVFKYTNMSIGDECDENAITDYKTFSNLCDLFNGYQSKEQKIDFKEIIDLRDALAHGRVLGDKDGNMVVIKYSLPKENKVTVKYKRDLNILRGMAEKISQLGMEISLKGGAKKL